MLEKSVAMQSELMAQVQRERQANQKHSALAARQAAEWQRDIEQARRQEPP